MYNIGDIIETKKDHVCKNNKWVVIRTGADIKLECMVCKRVIMVPMFELKKMIKQKK